MSNAIRRALLGLTALLMLAAGHPTTQHDTFRLSQAAPETAARTQQLDALFAGLAVAKSEEEAEAAIAQIWKLWMQSGQTDVDALMDQAARLLGAGLSPLALPLLDDIVARAPNWAEGWNKRATALYLAGEHERSLADIDRTLKLEPRHFGALAGIALIHMARGEFRQALAAYRRALAVNPFLRERLELIPALEKKVGESPT